MNKPEYHKRWFAKLKADPERHAEYLRKMREHGKKARTRLKADPERLAVRRQKAKERELANSEYRAKYLREWRAANREKLNRAKLQWAKDNPEKTVAIKRKYRQANSEKLNEYSRKKREANPGKKNEYTRKRRAIKLNALGSHTEAEWQALKSYYMDQCLRCGDVPDVLECDHVVPLSRGGSDDISNCQPLCRSCNGRKHAKIIDYR